MSVADQRQEFCASAWSMRSWPQRYGFACAAVVMAVLIDYGLDTGLGFTHPFVLLFPVILVVALWGGFGPGLLATMLSAGIAQYLFFEPLHSFVVRDLRDIMGLGLFVASGAAISGLGGKFKRRTQRLQEFEKAVEGVPEMVVVLDRDYRYLIANRMFLSYFGRKREDVLGRRVPEVMDPGVFGSIIQPRLEECFAGRTLQFELRNDYPQKGERDILVSYFPIFGMSGVDRVTVILQDVTEKKRTEETLRRREEDYRLFVERSSEGIFREELSEPIAIDAPEEEMIPRIRRDSYVAECNDALARMYGFRSAQEMVGKRLGDMLVPDDPDNLELMREYIRGGFRLLERYSNEVDQQGNRKVFRNSMIGIVEEGKLVRTWGIQSDVTEHVHLEEAHRKSEEALKASEIHFRTLVEQASDGIFIADSKGGYTDVNSAGAEMLGYSRAEILQLTIADVVIPEDAIRIESEVARFAGGGTIRSDWTFRRKDGSCSRRSGRPATRGRETAGVRPRHDGAQIRGRRDAAQRGAISGCIERFSDHGVQSGSRPAIHLGL